MVSKVDLAPSPGRLNTHDKSEGQPSNRTTAKVSSKKREDAVKILDDSHTINGIVNEVERRRNANTNGEMENIDFLIDMCQVYGRMLDKKERDIKASKIPDAVGSPKGKCLTPLQYVQSEIILSLRRNDIIGPNENILNHPANFSYFTEQLLTLVEAAGKEIIERLYSRYTAKALTKSQDKNENLIALIDSYFQENVNKRYARIEILGLLKSQNIIQTDDEEAFLSSLDNFTLFIERLRQIKV